MSRTAALAAINQTQHSLATTARAVADALKDSKVTPMEGMMLGMSGMQLATQILMLFQGQDAETRADMLYILEHGQWTLPEGA